METVHHRGVRSAAAGGVEHSGSSRAHPPPDMPSDGLSEGIRWGLLFSALGFWLPVVAILTWRGLDRP